MTTVSTDQQPEDAASDRHAAFAAAVSERKLRTAGTTSDRVARILGIVLIAVGVLGAFMAYNNSLAQDDLRDIGSSQILATAFVAIAVVGVGLYVVGAIARVLRLWLLRQLVESQDRAEQLAQALRRDG